jgi:hypothetical protein
MARRPTLGRERGVTRVPAGGTQFTRHAVPHARALVARCQSARQKPQAIPRLKRARSCIWAASARTGYTHQWPHGVKATRPAADRRFQSVLGEALADAPDGRDAHVQRRGDRGVGPGRAIRPIVRLEQDASVRAVAGRCGASGDLSRERCPLALGQGDPVRFVHPGAWSIRATDLMAGELIGAGVTRLTAPGRAGALCWSYATRVTCTWG